MVWVMKKPVEVAKFDHGANDRKVQFNKRVTRREADGSEIGSLRSASVVRCRTSCLKR